MKTVGAVLGIALACAICFGAVLTLVILNVKSFFNRYNNLK